MYTGVFQKPQLYIHDSGHDSPRFKQDGKNEVHWDRNPASIVVSYDAPKVSARYIYCPTTLHAGSATIHQGRATNAHDTSKIRYSASMVQAGSATTFSCCILDES